MSERLLDIEEYLNEADSLLNMFQHPGWKVLMKEAQAKINSYGRGLVYADDIDKIKRLQANIRALDFLVSFPKDFVEAANKAKAERESESTVPNEAPAQADAKE